MQSEQEPLPYRQCAGIVLFNDSGMVLVGKRIDQITEAWQMPQGGIDENEEPLEAALRELEEEINTGNVKILAESKNWYKYDIPKNLRGKLWKGRYRGQNQKWFAMKYLGEDNEIQPQSVEKPEFSDWKWSKIDSIVDSIVPFKREVYKNFKGWNCSTKGIKKFDDLPDNAKIYIKELEKFIETKVASISTSPERDDTILIVDPFSS